MTVAGAAAMIDAMLLLIIVGVVVVAFVAYAATLVGLLRARRR